MKDEPESDLRRSLVTRILGEAKKWHDHYCYCHNKWGLGPHGGATGEGQGERTDLGMYCSVKMQGAFSGTVCFLRLCVCVCVLSLIHI